MSDLQKKIEELRQEAEWADPLPKDPGGDGMVKVPLASEDWQARAEAMAALEVYRAELVEEKTDTAREFTAKLRVVDEQIARLAAEIETKEKWVDPQQPLQLAEAKKSRRAVQRGTQDAGAVVEP